MVLKTATQTISIIYQTNTCLWDGHYHLM